jgi:hypothetical protein
MSNVSAPPVPDLLPIAAAAVATTFIERKRLFKGQSSIDLCDALANRPNGAFFNAAGGTATVRNYTLENVILDASTLLLLKDGRVIAETAYFLPSNDNGQRSMQPTAPLGANEVLIFGTNNAHWGYQHWLTQCLPAIDWSLRQPRTFDVRLLLPNMRPWQEDFLELLGYASVPRLMPRPGELYVLPRVEFSEFISGASSFEISLTLLDTVRRILDAVPSLPSAGKLLYLPDPNAQHGSISNEAAAIELLPNASICSARPMWWSDRWPRIWPTWCSAGREPCCGNGCRSTSRTTRSIASPRPLGSITGAICSRASPNRSVPGNGRSISMSLPGGWPRFRPAPHREPPRRRCSPATPSARRWRC